MLGDLACSAVRSAVIRQSTPFKGEDLSIPQGSGKYQKEAKIMSVASSMASAQEWHVTTVSPNRMTIAVMIENAFAAMRTS
jgi:hypothetical protein